MKYLISIVFGILMSTGVWAQSLDRQVVGSAGYAIQNNNAGLNQSVGEVVVQTGQTQAVVLTQGFQQPEMTEVTGIFSVDKISIALSIYPNPVRDRLRMKSNLAQHGIGSLRFEVYDMQGRLCIEGNLVSAEDEIVVNMLQPATYSLVLEDAEKQFASVTRFVKL